MVERRWLRSVGPGLIALGTILAMGSSVGAARDRVWTPLACVGGGAARVDAVRAQIAISVADAGIGAWMRLDPTLDAEGTLTGQRLAMGVGDQGATRSMALPAELFAAGPFGRLLLVGADDGSLSRLFTVDVATGCTSSIAEEPDVIRRATIAPDGEALFETRVERTSRADLGVWRRPLDGTRAAVRILAPLVADGRFGRTWSTEFAWSLEGDQLAVQSCGAIACRTRVLDPVPGAEPVHLVADPGLGPLVGLSRSRLVAYAACRGLPCPIASVDIASGQRTPLSEVAGLAVLSGSGDGARLVHEIGAGSGRRLRSATLDGRGAVDLGVLPDGLRLTPDPTRSSTGAQLPPDWVLLSPDGRPSFGTTAIEPRPTLRHVPDGASVPLGEVTR